MTISNKKLAKFKVAVGNLIDQELRIKSEMKSLYDSLVAEAADEKMALRQIKQAYFQVQKSRVTKLLEEKLEFHPFFGASISPLDEAEELEDDEELD